MNYTQPNRLWFNDNVILMVLLKKMLMLYAIFSVNIYFISLTLATRRLREKPKENDNLSKFTQQFWGKIINEIIKKQQSVRESS